MLIATIVTAATWASIVRTNKVVLHTEGSDINVFMKVVGVNVLFSRSVISV